MKFIIITSILLLFVLNIITYIINLYIHYPLSNASLHNLFNKEKENFLSNKTYGEVNIIWNKVVSLSKIGIFEYSFMEFGCIPFDNQNNELNKENIILNTCNKLSYPKYNFNESFINNMKIYNLTQYDFQNKILSEIKRLFFEANLTETNTNCCKIYKINW